MSKEAYDREPDHFVITRALACFERSLLSGYSLYDQYQNYDKPSALSDVAIRGMNLFFSDKAKKTILKIYSTQPLKQCKWSIMNPPDLSVWQAILDDAPSKHLFFLPDVIF